MMRKFGLKLFTFIFTLSSVMPMHFATAVELDLNRGIVARNADAKNDVLDRVGYLRPGTKVRIPERFWPANKEQSEEAIMKWLKETGDLREFSLPSGNKSDYYLPVEVTDAKNSTGVEIGTEVYVPIRFLIRNDGLSLVVSDETHAVAADEVGNKSQNTNSEREAELLSREYFASVERYIAAAEKKTQRNKKNRKGALAGKLNFEATCPITFEKFQSELEEVAGRNFIPSEMLLSIMHLETVGRCFAYRQENDGSASIGLFQLNTKTSSVPACTKSQLRSIKKLTSIKQLREPSVRCLQNPVANLDEAARVLREKYAMVNDRKQPAMGRWYTIEREGRDDWRKALAAYNGGQGYVYQAYNDLMDFNNMNNTDLDPDNWEHRRLFFFRQMLDANIDQRYFEESIRYRRSLNSILTNMAYVESIAGRESRPVDLKNTLIFRWINQLYYQG